MQGLFVFLERGGESAQKIMTEVYEQQDKKNVDDFAVALLKDAMGAIGKLKVILRAYANQTHFHKIAPINKAILLMGINEMMHFATPSIVVINEYIDIAKAFGEEKSAGFINGVLDAFRHNREPKNETTETA